MSTLEEQIKQDYEAGLSTRQLASKYQKSLRDITKILKKNSNKIEADASRKTEENQTIDVQLILSELEAGTKPVELCLKYGLKPKEIRSLVKDYQYLKLVEKQVQNRKTVELNEKTIHYYREAVKRGYTGSLDEFVNEIIEKFFEYFPLKPIRED